MSCQERFDSSDGFLLSELTRELPSSTEVVGDARIRITGVKHDSREVISGDMFVARVGAHVDGAAYAADAVARGAVAVMSERETVEARALGVPVVLVDDAGRALATAASVVYGRPSSALKVVGITGTNGKTTTAYLVRSAVDGALGRPSCGIIGTVEQGFKGSLAPSDRTTPEADDIARAMAHMRDLGASHVAMEVSSHALALGRVEEVRFRVAAFTNLTQDHLDFHGSMEAYADAKAMLFLAHRPDITVINVDTPYGRQLASRISTPRLCVSARLGADSEISACSARVDEAGIDASVRTPRGDVKISSRLLGAHNLENLLLALGIAVALELDPTAAAAALSCAPGAPGRLERCDEPGDDIQVVVDYAHTPDALARVLDAIRAASRGRIVCVFGCGGDRDRTKRRPMGEVVGRKADIAIVTSDNPRSEDPHDIVKTVAEGVRAVSAEPIVETDRSEAIDIAIRTAKSGDVVVIAGKGHETVQVVGSNKIPFDDRREARCALARRRGV